MAIVFGLLAFVAFVSIQIATAELFPKSLNDPIRIVSALTFGFSLVSLVIQAL
jgi:hypothetical protein